MKNINLRCVIVPLSLVLLVVNACGDDDYLAYDIPPTAVKLAPYRTGSGTMAIAYMSQGTTFLSENMVASEEFEDAKMAHLIKRNLYKNGLMHGVQREWHENGLLSRESPYKEGVMHGTFRKWDEAGNLVARYDIQIGKGTKKIYDSNGRLAEHCEIVNGEPSGRSLILLRGAVLAIGWRDHGLANKVECRFFLTGELESICFWAEGGRLNGPVAIFNAGGSTKEIEWRVGGRNVTEKEYSDIVTKASIDFPPYYSNAQKYKALVDAETKMLVDQYRKMPRVKIPLEFDKDGNPVIAK